MMLPSKGLQVLPTMHLVSRRISGYSPIVSRLGETTGGRLGLSAARLRSTEGRGGWLLEAQRAVQGELPPTDAQSVPHLLHSAHEAG